MEIKAGIPLYLQILESNHKILSEACEAVRDFFYESNPYVEDCPICKRELPYHHGKCPKHKLDQALKVIEGIK